MDKPKNGLLLWKSIKKEIKYYINKEEYIMDSPINNFINTNTTNIPIQHACKVASLLKIRKTILWIAST